MVIFIKETIEGTELLLQVDGHAHRVEWELSDAVDEPHTFKMWGGMVLPDRQT